MPTVFKKGDIVLSQLYFKVIGMPARPKEYGDLTQLYPLSGKFGDLIYYIPGLVMLILSFGKNRGLARSLI